MDRTIVIGDVHGCLEELRALLRTVEYRPRRDRLVFAGDLIDRGPDPVGCLRLARELGADCVLGNHEEKALRWRRYEARRISTGEQNPMRPPRPERVAQWQALSEHDLGWIASLPLTLDLGDRWLLVHGGLLPGLALTDQKPGEIIRCRWVDGQGQFVGLRRGDARAPEGAVFWTQRWDGDLNVVYGHAVHSLKTPRVDQRPQGVECWGIDTGCAFGGRLTALLLPSREVVQVPSRGCYAEWRGQDKD